MSVKRYQLGRLATAYYNEADTEVSYSASGVAPGDISAARAAWATWLDLAVVDGATKPIGNLMDVTLGLASDQADATTREVAAFGFSSSVAVLKGSEVTFDMRWEPFQRLDTSPAPWAFQELLAKTWQEDGKMSAVFLDQNRVANPTGGGNKYPAGMAANFSVSIDISQGLRDIQRASVTMTVSDDPVWYNESIPEN